MQDDGKAKIITPDNGTNDNTAVPQAETISPSEDLAQAEVEGGIEPDQETESPFSEDDNTEIPLEGGDYSGPVTWSASEYIDHDKNPAWYLGLGTLIVLIAIGVFFLTKSIFSSVMVLIIGVVFGVVAARKPRTLEYTIDNIGVRIGEKGYPYNEIKSFSLVEDAAINSIQLVPFKRFTPSINIYFEAKDEDRILDTISNFVPHEEAKKDPVEHLMKRIKF